MIVTIELLRLCASNRQVIRSGDDSRLRVTINKQSMTGAEVSVIIKYYHATRRSPISPDRVRVRSTKSEMFYPILVPRRTDVRASRIFLDADPTISPLVSLNL